MTSIDAFPALALPSCSHRVFIVKIADLQSDSSRLQMGQNPEEVNDGRCDAQRALYKMAEGVDGPGLGEKLKRSTGVCGNHALYNQAY